MLILLNLPSQDEDGPDGLMTQSAQALALSPPRAPPHDSAHRTLLIGRNPSDYALVHHHDNKNYHFEGIRHKLSNLLEESHKLLPRRIPHPHLPAALEYTDKMTRALGTTLPMSWLNAWRDSGGFRSTADALVTTTAPTMGITNPSLAFNFLNLTRRCLAYGYGKHNRQVIHVFFPNRQDYEGLSGRGNKPRGLLCFVHGGAWGSGLPWMYRLIAIPFLKLGMLVSIIGYRTYPDANVDGQVDDLEQAITFLAQQFPDLCINMSARENPGHLGTCLMGHSSGAHIALLMLVDRARRKIRKEANCALDFDSFIGLSGPYDISHHFDYEAARGVEELSPMKPACGYSREAFRQRSPALLWMQHLTDISETTSSTSIKDAFPRILLVHGIEDSTVPFTATAEAARILRSSGVLPLQEVYVAKVGHQDTVMEIMIGGKTLDAIIEWLQQDPFGDKNGGLSTNIASRSKL
jgi:acetyl esterase/lipase